MRFISLTLSIIIVFLLNWFFPFIEDDYYYALNTNNNLSNIIYNWYSDFLNINPRIAGIWGRLIIRTGHLGFDIINSIIFFIFCFSILRLFPVKKNMTNFLALILFLTAYIPPFIWTDSFFWASGSVNYLWSVTLLLLFFAPFHNYIFQNTYNKAIPSFLYLILGIIVGLTNENSIPSIVLISFIWLYFFNNKKNKPNWLWLGLLGLTIGSIILITAPGQQSRLMTENFDAYREEDMIASILRTIRNFLKFSLYNLPLIIATIIIIFLGKRNSIRFKFNSNNQMSYWLGACFLSIFAFHFSPVIIYRNRLIFISSIFLFIGSYSVWLQVKTKLVKQYLLYIKIITSIIASINVIILFIGFFNLHIENKQMIKNIEKQLPNKNIVTTNEYSYDKWFKFTIPKDSLIYTDGNHWKNKNISNYYNIESIKLK